jgi:hypothetical protein
VGERDPGFHLAHDAVLIARAPLLMILPDFEVALPWTS